MPNPMCGPAGAVTAGKRPMCGPRPGGAVWKQNIANDVRRANLAKARAVKKAKQEELNSKKKEQDA